MPISYGRKTSGGRVELTENPTVDPVVVDQPGSAMPDVLSSGQLAPQPEIQIPEVPPETQVDGVMSQIESQAQNQKDLASQLQQAAIQTGNAEQSSFLSYINTQLYAPTRAELEAQEYSANQVDQLQGEVSRITNDILAEQNSLRMELKELDRNEQGLFRGALTARKQKKKTESLDRQAAAAIVLDAIQGRYESAKRTADRAVEAKYADAQRDLDVMATIYNRNKELFDRNESRLFELEMNDRERELNAAKDAEKLLQTTKIDAMRMAQMNNAPADVIQAIQSAETPEEVLVFGGAYGSVDMLQRQKLLNEIANQSWTRRKNLLELANEGDRKATDELGFDPRDTELTAEEYNARLRDLTNTQQAQNTVSELLANERGIKTSTGAVQAEKISGFFSGGTAEGAGRLTRFLPVIGNVQGVVQTINNKNDFLSGVSFLVNDTTFQEVINMKAAGITFGNMTEGERVAAGRAANELNSAVVIDADGTVTGIRASEDSVREWLNDIGVAYKKKEDEILADIYLSESEKREISK